MTTSDNSTNTSKAQIEFAFDGVKRKFDKNTETLKDGVTTKWTRSIVASPEVSFSIVKRADDQLLDQVDRSTLGLLQAVGQIDSAAGDSIYAPFALLEQRFSQWLRTDGFQIKRVSRDGNRVRVDFAFTSKERAYNGSIRFLPQRLWVIDGWDITLKLLEPEQYTWRIVNDMTYGSDDPVPSLTGSSAVTYHQTHTDREKMIVEKLSFAKVADDEFKLSRYGYSDRLGLPARFYESVWFWAATLGVICIAGAAVIRAVRRREKANPKTAARQMPGNQSPR